MCGWLWWDPFVFNPLCVRVACGLHLSAISCCNFGGIGSHLAFCCRSFQRLPFCCRAMLLACAFCNCVVALAMLASSDVLVVWPLVLLAQLSSSALLVAQLHIGQAAAGPGLAFFNAGESCRSTARHHIEVAAITSRYRTLRMDLRIILNATHNMQRHIPTTAAATAVLSGRSTVLELETPSLCAPKIAADNTATVLASVSQSSAMKQLSGLLAIVFVNHFFCKPAFLPECVMVTPMSLVS